METNLSANCSIAAQTNGFLIRISGSLGAISVATCSFALILLLYLKLYKQFLYRLAAYQVMASLLHALLGVCEFSFLDYNDSMYTACAAVGYLFMVAGWMKTCFGCWVTFHLFCFAVLLKNMRKLELLYVISSVMFPVTISLIPLITTSYGPTGEWCFIQRKKCGKNYVVGDVELLALWYGPAFVILVLQSVAMLAMMITVYYRAHRKSDENVFGRDRNRVAFRQLIPLVAYPVLFCILITPALIARVYGFASSTPNEGLRVLLAICLPAWSFSAGVTLIIHIGALRCAEIVRILFPMVGRARDASRITEEPPRDTTKVLSNQKGDGRSSTYFSIASDN